jgi:hypothetical protein
MSLQTIVGHGLGGRLHLPRRDAAVAHPQPVAATMRLEGASMRWLETTLALFAIATALLIGVGH